MRVSVAVFQRVSTFKEEGEGEIMTERIVSWLWVDCEYFRACHTCPYFKNCTLLKEKEAQPKEDEQK
jgi:hypothetical protein